MDPVLVQVGEVRIWYYGLAYAIGLLTVHAWVYARREHLGYDRGDVAWFSFFFATGVLAGGRLFDVALYEWFYYVEHPRQIVRVWEGGMATHGVLLGAVVGTALFCRLRDKSLLEVADELVIPGAVLMALGRVGNHINGEVYGSVTSVPWAMSFPYAEGCRHPVALYDGAKNLLLVPILIVVRGVDLRRYGRVPRGVLLGHFVFWYAFLRLFVDLFREYDSYWLGVGRGQYFNAFMAAAGLAVIAAARRHARRRKTSESERTPRAIRRDVVPSWVPSAYSMPSSPSASPSRAAGRSRSSRTSRTAPARGPGPDVAATKWRRYDGSSPFSRRDGGRGRGERGRRRLRRDRGPGRADARRLAGDAGHGRASGGRRGELGR